MPPAWHQTIVDEQTALQEAQGVAGCLLNRNLARIATVPCSYHSLSFCRKVCSVQRWPG
jgi:hypothetical protein